MRLARPVGDSTLTGNSTGTTTPEPAVNGSFPAPPPTTAAGVNGSFAPPTVTHTRTTTQTAGAVPPPTFTPPAAAPPAKPGRSPRIALIALGALGLVAVAVAVVILTTHNNGASKQHTQAAGASATSAYRGKLRTALTPLVSANQRLSNSLGSIATKQTDVGSAQKSNSAAQTALATARGAVSAITAPPADKSLSQQVQQAFDNENGYLTAVSATLVNPHSSQASQLQTLATSLQSSMVPLDPVASGASSSVSGAGTLSSWANAAGSRAAARHKSQHHQKSQATATSTVTATTTAISGGGNPYANGEYCGNGVYAGPDTSCPFAQNVFTAWQNQPSVDAVVEAHSPVTGQNYAMTCQEQAGEVTCTGGIGASVSWAG